MYKKWLPLVVVLLSLALVSGCGVQPSGLGIAGNTGGLTSTGYGNLVGFTADDPHHGGGGGGGGGGSTPNEYELLLQGMWANDFLQVWVSLNIFESAIVDSDSYTLSGMWSEYDEESDYYYEYSFYWSAGSSSFEVQYTSACYYDPDLGDYVDIPIPSDESGTYTLSEDNNTWTVYMGGDSIEFTRQIFG